MSDNYILITIVAVVKLREPGSVFACMTRLQSQRLVGGGNDQLNAAQMGCAGLNPF